MQAEMKVIQIPLKKVQKIWRLLDWTYCYKKNEDKLFNLKLLPW